MLRYRVRLRPLSGDLAFGIVLNLFDRELRSWLLHIGESSDIESVRACMSRTGHTARASLCDMHLSRVVRAPIQTNKGRRRRNAVS